MFSRSLCIYPIEGKSMKSSVELLSITVFVFVIIGCTVCCVTIYCVCSLYEFSCIWAFGIFDSVCSRDAVAGCCCSRCCRRSFLLTLIGVVWSVLFNLFFTTVLCGFGLIPFADTCMLNAIYSPFIIHDNDRRDEMQWKSEIKIVSRARTHTQTHINIESTPVTKTISSSRCCWLMKSF